MSDKKETPLYCSRPMDYWEAKFKGWREKNPTKQKKTTHSGEGRDKTRKEWLTSGTIPQLIEEDSKLGLNFENDRTLMVTITFDY